MDKKHHFNSLASRLSLWIISFSALIFITVIAANHILSRSSLEKQVEAIARTQAAATANEIEAIFNQVEKSADSLASLVSTARLDERQIKNSIKAFLDANEHIFGMTVALEPRMVLADRDDFSPYFFRNNDTIDFADLADQSYRYKTWPWYTGVKDTGASLWSEPYLDDGGGGVLMITYSSPVFLAERQFAGVTTADIQLSWLDQVVRNIKAGDTGYGFILSENDVVIAHPNKTIDLTTLDKEDIDPENWSKYQDSKQHESTVYMRTRCKNDTEDCWLALETLGDTGWKIAIVIPEPELTEKTSALTYTISAIALAGLILLFMAIMMLTKLLTRPLGELASVTGDIGSGNLDIALPKSARKDEIGSLTDDFETMRIALKAHIEKIRETSALQQKLESEIEIANDIQMSMLPGNGNIYLPEDSHQLYAFLRPARSVGGDLYYYQRSGDRLDFIIGDVSDKGVPAALFMAKAVTLYTRALRDRLTPGEALTMMNDILTDGNDACMFVTALCGCLNLEDGTLTMANAGHMNPIAHSSDDTSEKAVDGATALGLMEGVEYSDNSLTLNSGESLIMFTDGISEAHDSNNEQYSVERLIEIIGAEKPGEIERMGNSIIVDVDSFATGTEQFDDITLLIIQYR